MTLSSRRFLIDQDGVVYRLANAAFDRMLRDPCSHVLPALAGQRVRMADLIVEIAGGAPVRVLRSTFATLSFDDRGRMDSGRFTRQQWARAESAFESTLGATKQEEKVFDAAAQFTAQGGTWRPSSEMNRAINEAALGKVRCPRL